MGESAACLRRSISCPSSAYKELQEGDPLRALTDSISFGRFMQESLAWEKWSAFAHNRRLEEVENLSKPGSVAQKKAYFEAYYQKKAARKATAEVEEAATSESVHESQSNFPASVADLGHSADSYRGDTSFESSSVAQQSISTDMRKENVSHHVALDEHGEMYPSVETSAVNSSSDKRSSVIQDACAAGLNKENAINCLVLYKQEEKDALATVMADSTDAISVDLGLDKNGTEVVTAEENEGTIVQQSCDTMSARNLVEPGNRKDPENDSSMQGDELPAEKTVVHEVAASESKKGPVHSIKSLSRARASKIPLPPSKSTISRKSNNVAPVEKKSIRPVDKKKSTNSLHMSINLSSSAARKSNTLLLTQIENTKVHTLTNQKAKDSSPRPRCPTTASVSGMLKHPLITPRSEERRSRRLLSMSISGLAMNGKSHILSAESPKSSASSSSKARSSPFKFRTEERAAKRKEKLEEKTRTKEAEKTQLQTRSKDKVENDPKILRRSTRFKPKPIEDSANGILSSIKQKKKVPVPLPVPVPPPQPPKPERKKIASTIQEASLKPPQRTLTTKDGSRHLLNRHTHNRACSVTSLPKKITHENASPNLES